MVDVMNAENRARLLELLNRSGVGPVCDIMNLVDTIVRDERDDAGRRGFNLGWDSAMDSPSEGRPLFQQIGDE